MHKAAQEICVFQVGTNQDPRGLAIWTLYFCLNSGLLFEDRFFILFITSSCQHPEWGRRHRSNVYITACSIESHLALLASELPWLSWQTPLSQHSSYALLSCIQNTAGLHECIATRSTEAHCQVLQSILNCPRYSWHTEIPSKTQKSWKNFILSPASPALFVHQFYFGFSVLLRLLLVFKGLQRMTAIPDSLPLEYR